MARTPDSSTTLSCEGQELVCENQVGSLNSTSSTPTQVGNAPPPASGVNTGAAGGTATQPYTPPQLCVGTFMLVGSDDQCAINEANIQASYVAESLSISGAPINVYPLLGVHQQGRGSIIGEGMLIGSPAAPGFPLSGINGGTGWRSLQSGAAVTTSGVYIGVDFGIKLLSKDGHQSEYQPEAQKWTSVGCVMLTQSNNPGFFAQQVRVDTANGDVTFATPTFRGTGNGTVGGIEPGSNVTQGALILQALNATMFSVFAQLPSMVLNLGTAMVGRKFHSTYANFTVNMGSIPFAAGDMFNIAVNYIWCRAGVFNVIQSPSPQPLNLNTKILVKAVRVTPIMFNGSGNWEVDDLDVLDGSPTNINNIQDLFFNENRDRDYNTTPIQLRCAYTPADSLNDLSKYGLNILDQYVFTTSFAVMVQKLGRPIMIGDILEVIPELQYDQNLMPVRKFLEVTDSNWASSGFSPAYLPIVYRFTAQQAMPSQETRDIFGTANTEKYLMADALFNNGIGKQVDTIPLTRTEEISKMAANKVPEVGSDDNRSVAAVHTPQAGPPKNKKGQPAAAANPVAGTVPNAYIEDALPPNGLPFGEGFAFPTSPPPKDGDYFRLSYPPETKIPARLFRFSTIKNRWIFLEQDRRGQYTSAKPSVRNILQSPNRVPIDRKLT